MYLHDTKKIIQTNWSSAPNRTLFAEGRLCAYMNQLKTTLYVWTIGLCTRKHNNLISCS